MLTHSIAFILGFSFVFIMLGISSSMIGQFLSTYQTYISQDWGYTPHLHGTIHV